MGWRPMKKKKGKLKGQAFNLDPWKFCVIVFHGEPKLFQDYAKKKYKEEIDLEHSLGYTMFTPGAPIIVWLKDLKNITTMSHELLHATSFILRDRGLKHTYDTEEAYTYTFTDLLDKVMKNKRWFRV